MNKHLIDSIIEILTNQTSELELIEMSLVLNQLNTKVQNRLRDIEELFIEEYVKDFSPVNAISRCGFASENARILADVLTTRLDGEINSRISIDSNSNSILNTILKTSDIGELHELLNKYKKTRMLGEL